MAWRKINAVNVAELIRTGNYDEILDKERQILGRDTSGNNDDTTATRVSKQRESWWPSVAAAIGDQLA